MRRRVFRDVSYKKAINWSYEVLINGLKQVEESPPPLQQFFCMEFSGTEFGDKDTEKDVHNVIFLYYLATAFHWDCH